MRLRIGLMAALILAFGLHASPAQATVVLSPTTAAAGSTTDLVFTVGNNGATAATTRFEIKVNAPAVVKQADVANVEGWSSTQERGDDDELTTITWSKGALSGTATQDFTVTVLVPSTVDGISFTATQAFADGTVTRYPADESTKGPTLTVTGGSTTTTVERSTTTTAPAPSAGKSEGWRGEIGGYLIWFGVAVTVLLYLRAKKNNGPPTAGRRRR